MTDIDDHPWKALENGYGVGGVSWQGASEDGRESEMELICKMRLFLN